MLCRTAYRLLAMTPLVVPAILLAAQTRPATPATQPLATPRAPTFRPATQPATQPAIPLATLRGLFDRTLKTAETVEASGSPAAPTQALLHYRRAEQLLQRFPALDVDPAVRERVAQKIAQLQSQVIQAHAARRAAASQAARQADPQQPVQMPRSVPARPNQPNYGAGVPIPAPGPF